MIPLLVLCVALLGSAAFAGGETGYYATNPLQLRHAARRSQRAALLERATRRPAAFLCTLLVANNLANDLAVHATVDLLARWTSLDPHLWTTVGLTPVVFLLGEVWPKQYLLARPMERILLLAPVLAAARLLLLPVTVPIVALLRAFGLDQERSVARHELAALLVPGRHRSESDTMVVRAAHRALDSHGRGLAAFVRNDLLLVPAGASLEEARSAAAQSRDATALLSVPDAPPRLLLGERLACAADNRLPEELAEELPVLSPELDLAAALQGLKAQDASRALIPAAAGRYGLLDLEHILGVLLADQPLPKPSP